MTVRSLQCSLLYDCQLWVHMIPLNLKLCSWKLWIAWLNLSARKRSVVVKTWITKLILVEEPYILIHKFVYCVQWSSSSNFFLKSNSWLIFRIQKDQADIFEIFVSLDCPWNPRKKTLIFHFSDILPINAFNLKTKYKTWMCLLSAV